MELYHIRAGLKAVFLFSLAVLGVSWYFKGRPVDVSDIHPLLLREPVQTAPDRAPFSFEYKGRLCHVRPVHRWEQWGLIVSHNDIESLADLVHDSTSVDTKDLCLIWGDNVRTNDFHAITFESGQFTCYISFDRRLRYDPTAVGNDHLITDSDAIRDQIADLHVGDQIHLRGLIVDYQMDDWRGFWRRTSTRRDDSGCEVVFVEELRVLRRGTPGWYAAFAGARFLAVASPLLWLLVFWLEASRPDSRIGEL